MTTTACLHGMPALNFHSGQNQFYEECILQPDMFILGWWNSVRDYEGRF